MPEPIHIALATDTYYVDFSMVVINSILRFHPATGAPLEFYIMTKGLAPEKQVYLTELEQKHPVRFHILPVDIPKFAARWGGMKHPTFFRLELADWLPDVKRIIYLDSDIVLLDDIEKFWNLDLQGKLLGGIGDRAGLQEENQRYCQKGFMFNAGILLLDLDGWRKHDVVNQLAQFWQDHQDMHGFADQGLLNAYFDGNYTMLPQRWNIINSVYRNPPVPGMYTAEEITEAIRNPGIVHFTGSHKPWLVLKRFHHPYGYTFCLCALNTPHICFWKKLKLWIKLHFNGGLVEAKKQRAWGKADIKQIKW